MAIIIPDIGSVSHSCSPPVFFHCVIVSLPPISHTIQPNRRPLNKLGFDIILLTSARLINTNNSHKCVQNRRENFPFHPIGFTPKSLTFFAKVPSPLQLLLLHPIYSRHSSGLLISVLSHEKRLISETDAR